MYSTFEVSIMRTLFILNQPVPISDSLEAYNTYHRRFRREADQAQARFISYTSKTLL